jgi:hypothetical protein
MTGKKRRDDRGENAGVTFFRRDVPASAGMTKEGMHSLGSFPRRRESRGKREDIKNVDSCFRRNDMRRDAGMTCGKSKEYKSNEKD